MPELKNQRHERFAQMVAGGKTATYAYQEIYGEKSADHAASNASRLKGTDKVKARISELKTKSADKVVTKHALTIQRRLEIAAEIAESSDNDAIRLRAIMVHAELAGDLAVQSNTFAAPPISVNVNVAAISEERRAEMISKKQEAINWIKNHKLRLATPVNGTNGTNGTH